ncbi:TPA: site-specific DNA-methyltransferase [Enterococcus faecium]|nr:site-specific DNA-methyltransferase [Enterococcus faecium]HDL0740106.1 site-specific DNA-methyltransferase [Enterococcus faecium]HDL0748879.1 site-specific DNA-methyltransferase [Enterococcus faecium]HDL2671465.1 site-specific DNA-methyltransferase [Enterococcus faecium]
MIEQKDLFEFDKLPPIKGFPELRWTNKRPYRSTQYYPAQLKETYGQSDESGWINKIFWGDNLQVMSHMLREYRGKVDLIYIDPPYDSKADYKKKIKIKGIGNATADSMSFEEKQYSDIWTNDEYLQFMYERLTLLRELLSDKGSIYIHADWHKVHHLRLVMDEIFGPNNFRNEIIRWYLWGGRGKKQWNSKHENILFYSKSDNWTFNYMDVLDDHNLMTEGSKNRLNYAGAMVTTKSESSDIPEDKVLPSDTWYVATINAMANEKENYPTQKPENLLAKIILASSNENDLVFDCFMGSGTTQAVASKLGRRYIGSDINLGAIQTSTKRLLKIMDEKPNTTGFEVYNVNDYDFFRNELEAKQLIIDALEIQPMNVSNIYDGELDGRMVKIMPINRITTKFDLSELIANFPYDIFSKRKEESPSEPVERITIVCMGHEPDIKASLLKEVGDYKIDVNIVDILKDKKVLQLKRESEGLAIIRDNQVVIESFFPMNLLQKLSLDEQNVEDWRQLVESVLIDFNYDGAVLNPTEIDIPIKDSFVKGVYDIPEDAGTIRIKITDILSESLEIEAVK